MSTKTFNVKEKNILQFFGENAVNHEYLISQEGRNPDRSPYTLMKDEIIFKKDSGFKENETVVFHLKDIGRHSQTEMTHEYIYKVSKYDDLSLKLEIEDFRVDIIRK